MTGQLPSYLVVNAIVRDESGRSIVLVRQTTHIDDRPRWALPGGKVEEGESLIAALRRELVEETGLRYAAAPSLAYSSHYVLPGTPPVHATVHVFDGQGEGIMTALEAGPVASPDPEGDVLSVELVPLSRAVELLADTPHGVVREPAVAYLTGACPPGTLWSFPAEGAPGHGVMVRPASVP